MLNETRNVNKRVCVCACLFFLVGGRRRMVYATFVGACALQVYWPGLCDPL